MGPLKRDSKTLSCDVLEIMWHSETLYVLVTYIEPTPQTGFSFLGIWVLSCKKLNNAHFWAYRDISTYSSSPWLESWIYHLSNGMDVACCCQAPTSESRAQKHLI